MLVKGGTGVARTSTDIVLTSNLNIFFRSYFLAIVDIGQSFFEDHIIQNGSKSHENSQHFWVLKMGVRILWLLINKYLVTHIWSLYEMVGLSYKLSSRLSLRWLPGQHVPSMNCNLSIFNRLGIWSPFVCKIGTHMLCMISRVVCSLQGATPLQPECTDL